MSVPIIGQKVPIVQGKPSREELIRELKIIDAHLNAGLAVSVTIQGPKEAGQYPTDFRATALARHDITAMGVIETIFRSAMNVIVMQKLKDHRAALLHALGTGLVRNPGAADYTPIGAEEIPKPEAAGPSTPLSERPANGPE